MTPPHLKSNIVANHVGGWRDQYQLKSPTTSAWVKLEPTRAVDLLDDAKSRSLYDPHSGISASSLLDQMKYRPWKIKANPHVGGRPGADRVDMNLHITLYIYTTESCNNYTAYHLICKEEPRLHIIGITK
jgi:hypothetical protein